MTAARAHGDNGEGDVGGDGRQRDAFKFVEGWWFAAGDPQAAEFRAVMEQRQGECRFLEIGEFRPQQWRVPLRHAQSARFGGRWPSRAFPAKR